MKIAYDYKIFWNQKYGGISRYFTNLCKNLKSKEIDFKIFSPFFKNNYLKDLEKNNIQGTYIGNIPPYTSFFYKKYNDIMYKYSLDRWNPDIIHYTYYGEKKTKKKKPVVITVYDLIHEKISEQNGKLILAKKDAINLADEIICISINTKNELLNYYNVDEKKISIIYLGSDHLLNVKNRSTLPIKKKENELKKPFLLYVGSRNKYKNFNFFLTGIANSDKIKKDFNIILFGGGNLTKNEKLKISKLKLQNIFTTIEGDDHLLTSFYRNAELFIFPSIYEGFGLPMLEAMSFGCPVLCSNNNIFKELAKNDATYFDPFNIDDFQFQLESLIFSRARLKQASISGLKGSKNFTWEKCADETLKIYKKLI